MGMNGSPFCEDKRVVGLEGAWMDTSHWQSFHRALDLRRLGSSKTHLRLLHNSHMRYLQ